MNLESLKGIKLKYIGTDGPHSTVSHVDGKTVKVKNPDDTLGIFFRMEIDRSSTSISREMKDEFGASLMDIVLGKCKQQGQIAVLDAGCGTGHALYDIREQLRGRVGVGSEKITTVGVNDVDFSDESENSYVRSSIEDGKIRYLVDDLETVQLQSKAFDVIYSYETLIYNATPKVTRIVDRLLLSLADKGVLMFNVTGGQRDNPEFRKFLEQKLDEYEIFAYNLKHKKDAVRTFVVMQPR
jgi:SAM-dependent methyltransferase